LRGGEQSILDWYSLFCFLLSQSIVALLYFMIPLDGNTLHSPTGHIPFPRQIREGGGHWAQLGDARPEYRGTTWRIYVTLVLWDSRCSLLIRRIATPNIPSPKIVPPPPMPIFMFVQREKQIEGAVSFFHMGFMVVHMDVWTCKLGERGRKSFQPLRCGLREGKKRNLPMTMKNKGRPVDKAGDTIGDIVRRGKARQSKARPKKIPGSPSELQ